MNRHPPSTLRPTPVASAFLASYRLVPTLCLLGGLFATVASADEPDESVLAAGFKQLAELDYGPMAVGVYSETANPGSIEVSDQKIATVTHATVHMEGVRPYA